MHDMPRVMTIVYGDDEETDARIHQAMMRIVEHVLAARSFGDGFVSRALPSAHEGVLTQIGTCGDQCVVWPFFYPGWRPLTDEQFQHAWDAAWLIVANL